MFSEPLDEDDEDSLAGAIRRSDRYESTSTVSKGKKKKSLWERIKGGK